MDSTQLAIGSAAALAGAFLLSKLWNSGGDGRSAKNPPGFSLDRQSVLVPGTKDVYCSPLRPDGSFVTSIDGSTRTLYDMFARGMREAGGEPAEMLGTRANDRAPYEWLSYGDVLQRARRFGSGLRHLGLEAGSDTRVGIYMRNRPEWLAAALGCVTQSMTVVPLYDTLGADAARHIVAQCDMRLVLVDGADKVRTLLANAGDTPTLRHVVVADAEGVDGELQSAAGAANVSLMSLAEVLQTGAEHPSPQNVPAADDVYIICYTSGTTGTPKGVEITHANLVANVSTLIHVVEAFGMKGALARGTTTISYLPLSHMFEQLVHWMLIASGCRIGYMSGDVRGLTGDMAELRPHVFPAVPRLLNRLYDKINVGLLKQGALGRALFNAAYACKLAAVRRGHFGGTIWDRMFFHKVQEGLGGRVHMMATGAAPIAPEVLEMCRVTLGAMILEGYGQTECTALATCTAPTDTRGGHVGGPAPLAHVRLADVPELDYYSEDGKGEVCIRGPSVMRGYFKEPDKTRETIDEQGWLHTGDVGMWLPNGALKIIDRKKHIFKLAQGEYVAPEKIENVYARSPYVAQCFVEGDSLHRCLVAVLVVDQYLATWYENETGDRLPLAELCDKPKCVEFVMGELRRVGKENKLNSIEMVKGIKLTAEPFSVDNGLLTPTLKAKRPQLRRHYAGDIARLYAALD